MENCEGTLRGSYKISLVFRYVLRNGNGTSSERKRFNSIKEVATKCTEEGRLLYY
jgi:hypothetical protein